MSLPFLHADSEYDAWQTFTFSGKDKNNDTISQENEKENWISTLLRSKKNKTINFPDEVESKNKMDLSRNGSKLNKFSSLLRPKKNPFKLKKPEKPINYEQMKQDLKKM